MRLTIERLRDLLDAAAVPQDSYSLPSYEQYAGDYSVIMKIVDGDKYEVAVRERGYTTDHKWFLSEHDACVWFIEIGYLRDIYTRLREILPDALFSKMLDGIDLSYGEIAIMCFPESWKYRAREIDAYARMRGVSATDLSDSEKELFLHDDIKIGKVFPPPNFTPIS